MSRKGFRAARQESIRHSAGQADLLARGIAQHQAGQLDQAMAIYQQILGQSPHNAHALHLSGVVLYQRGHHAEACVRIQKAIALLPGEADFYCNLGNVLLGQRQYAEATEAYGQGLALQPGSASILSNLGVAFKEQGQYEKARLVLEQAVQVQAGLAEAWNNLGIVQHHLGDRGQAVDAYRRALEINPAFADAWQNLAVALDGLGEKEAAEMACRQALALDPAMAEAYHKLATIKLKEGDLAEALPACARALELDPEKSEVLCDLLSLVKSAVLWPDVALLTTEVATCYASGRYDFQPFAFLTLPTSAQEQLRVAQARGRVAANGVTPLPPHVPRNHGSRLRIGYLSCDFHAHATAYLIAELMELHDRARFEIFVYSFGPDDGSAVRQRIMTNAEHFVDIAALPHRQAAQRIRDDGVDILIDLKGYTHNERAAILAYRPAPIQVNWLGYPGSMGADFIDYIIADPFVIPEGQEHHYSERVIRLPACYQPNDRKRAIDPHRPSRAECGLPETGFVFCNFNQPYKIIPAVFDVWMRLLEQTPGAVLWLLEWNQLAASNLRMEAAARGIDPARLVFASGLPLAQHLARVQLADLFIDTFPVGAHTTASDALWAGLPVLALVGETFVSRVAGSLLQAAELPELVTYSLAEYEFLALALARDPAQLGRLRQRLAETRDTCALFDTPRFVEQLEAAYLSM